MNKTRSSKSVRRLSFIVLSLGLMVGQGSSAMDGGGNTEAGTYQGGGGNDYGMTFGDYGGGNGSGSGISLEISLSDRMTPQQIEALVAQDVAVRHAGTALESAAKQFEAQLESFMERSPQLHSINVQTAAGKSAIESALAKEFANNPAMLNAAKNALDAAIGFANAAYNHPGLRGEILGVVREADEESRGRKLSDQPFTNSSVGAYDTRGQVALVVGQHAIVENAYEKQLRLQYEFDNRQMR